MKQKTGIVLVGLLIMVLTVVACSGREEPGDMPGSSVEDIAGLVDGLAAAGATAELSGTVEQPFFNPEGQVISVDGQDVQAFEFDSASTADAAAEEVSPDGTSVGASIMMWMATPHFYKSGRLIVLYVGDQQETMDLLADVLGPQFAGG